MMSTTRKRPCETVPHFNCQTKLSSRCHRHSGTRMLTFWIAPRLGEWLTLTTVTTKTYTRRQSASPVFLATRRLR